MPMRPFQYQRFIWQQALTDLHRRYVGASLGFVWNVLHPLAMIAIYSIVFSAIMPVRLTGLPYRLAYVIYLCSGLFPWMAFSDAVLRATTALIASAGYLKKLPIPEYVFIAQATAASAISLTINFSLLAVFAVAVGLHPTWHWLLIPAALVLLLSLAFAMGLLLSIFHVFFRDTAELVSILLQIAVWTAPIIYTRDLLPAWAQHLALFHPATPAILMVHDLFLYQHVPAPRVWLAGAAWPVAALLAAFALLRRTRAEIRDLV